MNGRVNGRFDRYTVYSVVAVAVVFLAWGAASYWGKLNPDRFPPIQAIYDALINLIRDGYAGKPLYLEILASLFRALGGFVLAILVGVPIGALLGTNKAFAAVVTPFLSFLRPIPPIALIPLFIFYFGIGEVSKLALIFLTAFLYITLNTASGVKSVPRDLILASYSLGLTKLQVFTRVILPGALPQIITGMRIAMALCWALVVAAELIAAQVGLGYMIMDATTFFRIPVVYIGVLIIGVIGLALEGLFMALEAHFLHWRGKQ
ncbi:MAG TPA: ABC transporter permease [Burkholderiales bacterium]|jgi:NitT/TauT family transport system permease protein|nr:ABC transporter permease [Burkholderiales bacterium]